MPEAQGLSLREAEAMSVLGGRSEDLWEPQPEKTGHLPTVIHPQGDQGGSEALDAIHQRTEWSESEEGEEEEGREEGDPRRGGKEGGKSTQKPETGGEGWPRAPEEVGAGPGEGGVGVGPGPARTAAAPGAG